MVVIAALFIAFAVIAAAIVERNTALQFITRRDATMAQLRRLNNALIEYSVYNANGTVLIYPCPASPKLLTSSAAFGSSVNNGAVPPVDDCSTVDHTSDGVPFDSSNTDQVQGLVPVQTLATYGIVTNDAFDPWNNRIIYRVNRQLTAGGSGSNANNVILHADMTTLRTAIANPDYVLISFGRDGLGAMPRNQPGTIPNPCYNSTGYYNGTNCTFVGALREMPTNTAASGAAATALKYFDDILSFHNQ